MLKYPYKKTDLSLRMPQCPYSDKMPQCPYSDKMPQCPYSDKIMPLKLVEGELSAESEKIQKIHH